MTVGLLLVKAPRLAMQRLASILDSREREQLARSLFGEVLPKLLAVRQLDRVAVASNDREVLADAARAGALPLEEEHQESHSASAEEAVERLRLFGAETVLMAPIDVPLAASAEFESLIEAAEKIDGPGLVIVPSGNGDGTNALVRTPLGVIRSRFGPGSYQAHTSQALQRGIAVRTEKPAGIVFDIDTPEDLLRFSRIARKGPTRDFLTSINAAQRAEAFLAGRATAGKPGPAL